MIRSSQRVWGWDNHCGATTETVNIFQDLHLNDLNIVNTQEKAKIYLDKDSCHIFSKCLAHIHKNNLHLCWNTAHVWGCHSCGFVKSTHQGQCHTEHLSSQESTGTSHLLCHTQSLCHIYIAEDMTHHRSFHHILMIHKISCTFKLLSTVFFSYNHVLVYHLFSQYLIMYLSTILLFFIWSCICLPSC